MHRADDSAPRVFSWICLSKVAEGMEKTFIILDAFDQRLEKEDAIDTTLELFDQLSGKLNISVTCRHNPYLQDSLATLTLGA